MSGDELIVTLVALMLGPAAWAMWFFRLSVLQHLGGRRSHLFILAGTLVACAAALAVVLLRYAAPDVREAPGYLLLYFALGLAWIRLGEVLSPFAGVSIRDDVIERRNAAALPAACGALLGMTFCYAGGNIGSGPGWYVVVFSAALATAGLAAVWLLVHWTTDVSDLVTIDRDPATGLRLGGLLAASGLVLGRAVAGDWHSMAATVRDFLDVGWPVVPLAVVAVVIEAAAKPNVERPHPSPALAGVAPALIYLALACAYLAAIGWPP